MITLYKCEICRSIYEDKKHAEDCEAKWTWDPTPFEVWIMSSHVSNWSFVWIFCIAKVRKPVSSHYWSVGSRAVRTPAYPRYTLWDEFCWSWNLESGFEKRKKYNRVKKEHVWCSEYNEMVDYLRSRWIEPKYYNDDWILVCLWLWN